MQSDCIARISYDDGVVRSWILLHELRYTPFNISSLSGNF